MPPFGILTRLRDPRTILGASEKRDKDIAWEFELIHSKVTLGSPASEVNRFRPSLGYNSLQVSRPFWNSPDWAGRKFPLFGLLELLTTSLMAGC